MKRRGAYAFVRNGAAWTQQAYLKAGNAGAADRFGGAVAISGDTVVVGATGEDSGTSGVNSIPDEEGKSNGAAYVFVRSGTAWSQQAFLKASNPVLDMEFGNTVAVSGDIVVVGSAEENSGSTGVDSTPDGSATNAGAAYAYARSGTAWSQLAYLKPANTGQGDRFAESVAVSGDTIVVGAPFEDSGSSGPNAVPDENAADAGAAYVFEAGTPVEGGLRWGTPAIVRDGNQAQLRVIGEPGTTYTLYRSGSLAPMTWQPLADMTAPASGAMLFTDPAAAEPEFFYRIGEAGAPPGP
ncbi:MAG: hypothetical protein R3F11_15285 [Verrucomicrobiales bacterium]